MKEWPVRSATAIKNQLRPKLIEALRGTRVVAISAGAVALHSMVLSDDGTVFSFGAGESGQLGHGDEADKCEPKVIEALRGHRVVAIAAGPEHSVVLTDDGAVFTFGSAESGLLLGRSPPNDQTSINADGNRIAPTPEQIAGLSGINVV